jgi:cellulose synthase/poly-beta-1,6-N-acetylglucosamine synthase-like glycosyltransferase
MSELRPFVSVVIPILNEERHIRDCLESVIAQDYPADRIEVIVADGGSTDMTRDIVAAMAAGDARIRLVDNPAGDQAAGLNQAIAASQGEIVARLDGHAAWRSWHLSRCVELLSTPSVVNVGGAMEAVGETTLGKALALATRSPLGIGGARYRYANEQLETDTVFLGCFRRDAVDAVGGYDESLAPHEDYELNLRLRSAGGTIVFSPDIPTTYWTRGTWGSLLRQFFAYGRAKAVASRRNPAVIRPYHLAPPLLVGALPVLAVATARRRRGALLAALVVYGATCAVGAVIVGWGAPAGVRVRLPFVFPAMHIAWGLGFWRGLLDGVRSTR